MNGSNHADFDRNEAGDTPTLTVGELNRLIRYALSITFPDDLWVEGEIASLKRHEASGHVYFQLVEAGGSGQADATMSVALYQSDRRSVNAMLKRAGGAMRMADGVHIRIRGALDYYPPRGSLQLRMTAIDPAYTLGRLTAERERILGALAVEGLIDRNRSRPFPSVPTHIGLITSDQSAAHADFMDELTGSAMSWRVRFASVRVQGAGSERGVVAALRSLEACGVEVIALVRGGGARTDLVAFDSELMARAIAACSVPVVTGIGHEIDTSVADVVAARAHKTPTACAAALVDQARVAIGRAELAWGRIAESAAGQLESAAGTLTNRRRGVITLTAGRLSLAERALADRRRRLRRGSHVALGAADLALANHKARLGSLDPARALARGWSITRTADGAVVRQPAQVEPGAVLVTTVSGGTLRSRIEPGE